MKLLVKNLKNDYPDINFISDKLFLWNYKTSTIRYIADGPQSLLLHEVGHAVSHHTNYNKDISLIKIEDEAWTRAKSIGVKYGIHISDEDIQDCLDSYRDWLHKRSKCINCNANGIQIKSNVYRCPVCNSLWTVNPALQKRLRRRNMSRQ